VSEWRIQKKHWCVNEPTIFPHGTTPHRLAENSLLIILLFSNKVWKKVQEIKKQKPGRSVRVCGIEMGHSDSLIETQKPKIYTVSALTEQIKDLLEERFDFVWVEAEISNFRSPSSDCRNAVQRRCHDAGGSDEASEKGFKGFGMSS